MMRNVYLHGHLGEQFGTEFRLSVETVGEAIRAFNANFKGFLDALKEGEYELVRGDQSSGMRLGLDDVNAFRLGAADFHLVPVVAGSKNGGGIIKTVIGVALIGAAIFFSGGTLAAPLAGMSQAIPGLMGLSYGNMAMLGLSLAVAGVASMLAKTPPAAASAASENSFSLGGPGNTYEQGNPVPLVYGEVITGSVLVSAGLDIEQIPVDWTPLTGNNGTYNPEVDGDGSTPTTYTGPGQS